MQGDFISNGSREPHYAPRVKRRSEMKKTACAVALLLCVGLALPLADDPQSPGSPGQPNQGQQQNKKTQDLTVQVVSTDTQTMTITFKDNEGRDQTVPVMKSAFESLKK